MENCNEPAWFVWQLSSAARQIVEGLGENRGGMTISGQEDAHDDDGKRDPLAPSLYQDAILLGNCATRLVTIAAPRVIV
jgi:hypothetical protein